MFDRQIVSMLNDLIEVSKDGEKGFARAAQDSDDPALIQVFSNGEQSCRDAAVELQDEVRLLIERQYQGVVANHDRVRDLRNHYRS